ncbi:MAG TPA: AsmA family protein, partial [Acidiferrobacteraceae bacterium]|nr:AsmA family protein [Acidiferrobacteraceae bacterium]HEX19415.1 AsmA family protein [Acidiferrobacteraceae bacterium]
MVLKKLLKISALLAALLLLALIVIAVIFTLTFDPNAYKKEITAEVKKATGRTLRIKGKIQLSYFPWLGVNLSKMTLSNARGFGNQPFAKIDNAGVAVKLLPLISGNIVVKRLTLNGLVLNPRIRNDGSNNWDDLAGKNKKDT